VSQFIALHAPDSAIPNLALMKIARFELDRGNRVVAYDPLFRDTYDRIYASKVFSTSEIESYDPERMIIGGSGWDEKVKLPSHIESLQPSYHLYPDFKGNIGFAMRGCRYRCDFCAVPRKEGHAHSVGDIEPMLVNKSDFLVLLDNDFFGNPFWRECLMEIWALDLTVNFSQGINIRILSEEQAAALAKTKFSNLHRTRGQFHFAWDQPKDERLIRRGIQRCFDAGIKPWRMACYVLIGFNSSPDEDEHRVLTLKGLGIDPYAMPLDREDPYQQDFARWVNHRAIFNSTQRFADYKRGVRKTKDDPNFLMPSLLDWNAA
jgi:hypothetical protein